MELWILRWQTWTLALLGLLLLNGLLNARYRPRLVRTPPRRQGPSVSVLVPARNEAKTIAACVRALLAQTYRPLEVLVLDDQSTDATPAILQALQREHPALRVLSGAHLPPGWLGKNWACHQLAAQATGEILLFVDADTVLDPEAVAHTVALMEATGADLLSGLPLQVMGTWAERLSLPFLRFGTHSLMPTWVIRFWPTPLFALAVGQFLAIRRPAYRALGGHAAVRDRVLEDVALARRAMRQGHRICFADLRPLVRTRMYSTWAEIREGFLKNLWPVFGHGEAFYLFGWLFLWSTFALPWLGLLWGILSGAFWSGFDPARAWLSVGLAMSLWALFGRETRDQWWPVFFYPIIVTAFTYLALLSFYRYKRGQAVMWKERPIQV